MRTWAQLEFRPAMEEAALPYVTNGSVAPNNAWISAAFSDLMRLDNRARQNSGLTELPDIPPASANAINALYVKLSARDPLTLDLVSMGAPMAAIRPAPTIWFDHGATTLPRLQNGKVGHGL
ncbi:hypothetical protein [Sphingomonas ursincola]|uniref:hypothetical protein n=1 Tax=Sphingomonas ursincola TaxID=56361 RepID=UPI002353896E|nr:hypothetical protein [Sphingomonas ursincola]MBY0618482.1 hypothetical protein [Sphingomonas ursincola]